MAHGPSRTSRGERYDRRHQIAREAAARRHTPDDPCARCWHPLGPMGPHLHYDHDEHGGYLGFSHGTEPCPVCGQKCNLRAGAIKGNAIHAAVPRSAWVGANRQCRICNAAFLPMHPRQQCCGPECRLEFSKWINEHRAEREPAPTPEPRPCSVCGETFQPAMHHTRVCSGLCHQRSWRAKNRERTLEHQRRWREKKRLSL